MESAPKTPTVNPFEGLYGFARAHLLVINAVVLASTTVVSLLDFLAPKLSMLPRIIYSLTACLVLLMLVSACAPSIVARLVAMLGLVSQQRSSGPLWRRPAWQVSTAILVGVTVMGFVSVAKANQGGVIASSFPAAKSLQDSLLFGIKDDVARIGTGVDAANAKLDRIASTVDPDKAADRCADLNCAVRGGASPTAVRRLFDKGVSVPGNPVLDGSLLLAAALSREPGRFEVIDLLIQHGIDRDMLMLPILQDKSHLTKPGLVVAKEISDTARLEDNPIRRFIKVPVGNKDLDEWNDVVGCLRRSSGGVSLMELAALLGDRDLYAYGLAKGGSIPSRPLACQWKQSGKSGKAQIDIDRGTGKIARVWAG